MILDPLEHRRDALTAADAHRLEADSARRGAAISCSSVAMMRPPVAPIGWPIEMPEPLTLSRSKSFVAEAPLPRHRQHLRRERLVQLDQVHVAAACSPRRSSSFFVAGTGPMPM